MRRETEAALQPPPLPPPPPKKQRGRKGGRKIAAKRIAAERREASATSASSEDLTALSSTVSGHTGELADTFRKSEVDTLVADPGGGSSSDRLMENTVITQVLGGADADGAELASMAASRLEIAAKRRRREAADIGAPKVSQTARLLEIAAKRRRREAANIGAPRATGGQGA